MFQTTSDDPADHPFPRAKTFVGYARENCPLKENLVNGIVARQEKGEHVEEALQLFFNFERKAQDYAQETM